MDRTDDGLAVLTISGEHDLSTAPNLRSQIDGLVAERTPIVIDLSPASFIDSSILGVMLEGRRRAADTGIGFAVCQEDGNDAVARVLEITGLRQELPVHPDRPAAMAAAAAAGNGTR